MTPREQGDLNWIAIPEEESRAAAISVIPVIRDHPTGFQYHRVPGSATLIIALRGEIPRMRAYGSVIAGTEHFEGVPDDLRDRRARRMILAAVRCIAYGPYGDRLPRMGPNGTDAELLSILRAREAHGLPHDDQAHIAAATPLRSGGLDLGSAKVQDPAEPGCIFAGQCENVIEPDGSRRAGITIMADARIVSVPRLDPVSRMRLERRVDGLDGDTA